MEERHLAIHVKGLNKVYKLYAHNRDRLMDSLGLARKKRYQEHYALRGVDLDVRQGECVGIIGTNGSGKSTILKIITGVLNETDGEVAVNGRISALLELGAGFNPEYNGIENVYLNGTMIGFSEKEIDEKLQDILDFADIGDYVHQPVKTYSSGMFVRLAFAVAINIDPEILIVDEALSVGDVFFQAKCYHKFEEFKKQGKTILFVSHDLSAISKYCDRAVLLNRGVKLGEGSPRDMIDAYKRVLVGQYEEPEDKTAPEADGGTAGNAAGGQAGNGPDREWPGESAGELSGHGGTGSQSRERSGENAGNLADRGGIGGLERERPKDGAGKAGRGGTGGSRPEGNGGSLGNETNGIGDPEENAGSGGAPSFSRGCSSGIMQQGINPHLLEYGTREAKIVSYYMTDARGTVTSTILKGESFTLHMEVDIHKDLQAPIFALSIKDIKGVEITGTNTMVERAFLEGVYAGETVEITFSQKVRLQGGEYLISLGVTGYEGDAFTVYHRLYDVMNLTVVSDHNTVGFFDMESDVKVRRLEQPLSASDAHGKER